MKIVGLGFTFPCRPDQIQASTGSLKWSTNAPRSRLVFETSPIFTPRSRRSSRTGRTSS